MHKRLLILKQLLKKTKEIISSETFKTKHRLKDSDFTRKRKMTFEQIIYFILNLPRKSLSIELTNYLR